MSVWVSGHVSVVGGPDDQQPRGMDQNGLGVASHFSWAFPWLRLAPYQGHSRFLLLTQVEAIINPQFLQEAESTDRDRDIISAVIQELEEEYGLTPEEVGQRHEGQQVNKGQRAPGRQGQGHQDEHIWGQAKDGQGTEGHRVNSGA